QNPKTPLKMYSNSINNIDTFVTMQVYYDLLSLGDLQESITCSAWQVLGICFDSNYSSCVKALISIYF
ncbi:MAG: hypothetical protein ACKO96_32030, partial [Flammeovirgaceae bacterium]